MTIRNSVEKYIKEGFTIAQARSFVAQQILLSAIEKSQFVDKVLLKGGVVMYSISHEQRRTTLDLDFDFIRYDIQDDNNIINFINHLNGLESNIQIKVEGNIEKLNQQDYKGKRVRLIVSDDTYSIKYKLDIGIHTLLAIKQKKMCFSFGENKDYELMVNPPEQIVSEKLFSIAKIGPTSERFRDIDDIYYLIKNCSLDVKIVKKCLELITMNEPYGIKDLYDVVSKVEEYLNDPFFERNYIDNNGSWLDIEYGISRKAIIDFIYKL